MKQLPVTAPAYRYIEQSFKEWLDVLGYSAQSVYNMPIEIRGLLNYLERQDKTQIKDITAEAISAYYHGELRSRANQRQEGGALSAAHLNKHQQALKKFAQYLRQSGRLLIGNLNLRGEQGTGDTPDVLTEAEVQQLYTATGVMPERKKQPKQPELYQWLAMRDQAMLSVFYGCGLRRNEGYHLDRDDLNLDAAILRVRKGKGYKERLVPISRGGVQHLSRYIYDARPQLQKRSGEEAFFISSATGRRLSGQMLLLNLKDLIRRTRNPTLQQKDISLHTLRHSIATHLLGAGMSIERIKDFLGHDSLESTQIYTHLIHKDHEPLQSIPAQ